MGFSVNEGVIVWRCDCQCEDVIVSVWGCYDKCVKMWLSVCEGVIVLGCDCQCVKVLLC